MDAIGRIAGFFTWDKTKPMMRVMGRLASFFAAIAVVLFGFAALSLWQLKRARRELGEREVQAARAADEDKLTGLSNHGKTLELLDLALAERRDEDWTTFALIGLDGLEDVTAHHGVMGSDELVVAVARRLKQVLPVHAMCGHNLKRSEVHSSRTSAGDQRKTLEVYYQPIVSSQGGRMVGVEALLRWTHATRGAIEPTTFIPAAEQMGLMDTIGAFVLRRTLQNARRWPDDLYVAVNLSPLQVRDRTIVDTVRSALTESGVAPSRLVLEITEGVLIDDPDEMVKRISDLHGLGVRVAFDDFGSGYSNLGYLQRFLLDKLKIDRSFVSALGRSSNGGVIIQAIVALGRALGLSVLVEGVETEHQRVLLRLAGCDEMQGFLFAKPGPARVIDKLLAQAAANLFPPRTRR